MNEEVQYLREAIESNDFKQLETCLRVLPDHATGSPEMIALLESLIDDRRLCTISRPIYIGEIRYMAAMVLRGEREKAGIKEPMEIEVVLPLNSIEIGHLAKQYGIKNPNVFDRFSQLIAMNVVEMAKFTI